MGRPPLSHGPRGDVSSVYSPLWLTGERPPTKKSFVVPIPPVSSDVQAAIQSRITIKQPWLVQRSQLDEAESQLANVRDTQEETWAKLQELRERRDQALRDIEDLRNEQLQKSLDEVEFQMRQQFQQEQQLKQASFENECQMLLNAKPPPSPSPPVTRLEDDEKSKFEEETPEEAPPLSVTRHGTGTEAGRKTPPRIALTNIEGSTSLSILNQLHDAGLVGVPEWHYKSPSEAESNIHDHVELIVHKGKEEGKYILDKDLHYKQDRKPDQTRQHVRQHLSANAIRDLLSSSCASWSDMTFKEIKTFLLTNVDEKDATGESPCKRPRTEETDEEEGQILEQAPALSEKRTASQKPSELKKKELESEAMFHEGLLETKSQLIWLLKQVIKSEQKRKAQQATNAHA